MQELLFQAIKSSLLQLRIEATITERQSTHPNHGHSSSKGGF